MQKLMDDLLEPGSGAVYMKVFSDSGVHYAVELWGVSDLAYYNADKFHVDTRTVKHNNPKWLPDVQALVEKLNAYLNE